MNPANVLIVEDDTKLRNALKEIMTREGYTVDVTESGDIAVSMIKDTVYDLVITDLKLPGIDGMDVLRSVQKLARDTSVIIITAYATVDTAVEAMKEGAEDYIAKPFNLDEIRLIVRKVLDKKALVDDNRFLRSQLKKKYSFGNIVGSSEAMIEVYKMIEKVKDSKATVLILGETGTGKELVARAIHFNSIRSEKPFLPVNCAALAETLLESELFGYAKGAFTGATRDKQGVFEVAHGGYDPVMATENPNRVLPLDVARACQKESLFGGLFDKYPVTVGNVTAVRSAEKYGREMGELLKEQGVEGIVLTST